MEGPTAVSPDRSCRSREGKLDLRAAISVQPRLSLSTAATNHRTKPNQRRYKEGQNQSTNEHERSSKSPKRIRRKVITSRSETHGKTSRSKKVEPEKWERGGAEQEEQGGCIHIRSFDCARTRRERERGDEKRRRGPIEKRGETEKTRCPVYRERQIERERELGKMEVQLNIIFNDSKLISILIC